MQAAGTTGPPSRGQAPACQETSPVSHWHPVPIKCVKDDRTFSALISTRFQPSSRRSFSALISTRFQPGDPGKPSSSPTVSTVFLRTRPCSPGLHLVSTEVPADFHCLQRPFANTFCNLVLCSLFYKTTLREHKSSFSC